jgi:phosphonate transport system substrate-binding protein
MTPRIPAVLCTLAIALMATPAIAATAPDCPNGGTLRFGVEPYDTQAKLGPIYDQIGKLIGQKLGCNVQVFVTTSYNAEIEAMRNDKLELGQFGPLGYVLAHQVAHAQAVASFADKDNKPATYRAGIATWPGSGITSIAELKGHSFAYADPASTSGHLFPAFAIRKAGLDPDTDVKGIYAGSHTASFEALRNHKVEASELNSTQVESATQRGSYKEGDVVFLWVSDPIPLDPITIRGNLPEAFKAKLTNVLQTLDFSELPPADLKIIGSARPNLVPQIDAAYDPVRDLVSTLHIDLTKLD